MSKYINDIIDYAEGNLSEADRLRFEQELARNAVLKQEYALFGVVGNALRAKFDIADVESDGALPGALKQAESLVEHFERNPSRYSDIRSFIDSSILNPDDAALEAEVAQIQAEISEESIDGFTREWVKEWGEIRDDRSEHRYRSIAGFVSQSMADVPNTPRVRSLKWYNRPALRIVGLSAAAGLALLFVVRSLVAPVSPDDLFNENYKPYQAFTSISRSNDGNLTSKYNQAIVNYRQGNYELAAIEFDLIMRVDTFNVSTRFFAGLSQIELSNYPAAIELLSSVEQHNADYSIEAKWYLGLCHVKVNNLSEAIPYFEQLSSEPGYYQEPSRDILRQIR
ncbi:MAG: hypothetical protein H6536_08225 [Bacteroidales bacterium]|nr:hypothetical protein [Bacteroidales bacterium]